MCKKFYLMLCCLFLLAAFPLRAQNEAGEVRGFYTPDYEQIERDFHDKTSPRYYQKLIKRLTQGDTSFDIGDMHALYFGQCFSDDFNPYESYNEQFDAIRAIMSKETEPIESDVRRIVSLADKAIKQNPSELIAYDYKYTGLAYLASHFDGDTTELQKVYNQFRTLFAAIASTGDGLTPQTAMHVVNTGHEYMIIQIYGFYPTSQALTHIDGHCYDVFSVDSNAYGVDSLYFNIDRIVGYWSKLFPVETRQATSVDVPLGSRFVLELDKPKRKNSKFRLISLISIADTLVGDERDSLFKEDISDNQIVGYFCPTRLYAGSDHVHNCLIFISKCGKQLFYDSDICMRGSMSFQSTSNEGMFPNVMMNEMWNDPIQTLRISNIRTKR